MSTYQPVLLFTSTEQPRPLPAGFGAAPFGSFAARSVLMFVSAPPPRLDWAWVFTTFFPDFWAIILSSCAIDWLAAHAGHGAKRHDEHQRAQQLHKLKAVLHLSLRNKIADWWDINKNNLRESKIVSPT